MASQITPLMLSPTSSVSTPSTPGTTSVWDTPATPLRKFSIQSDFGLSTPLTPPVVSDGFGKTSESRAKPKGFPAADHISPVQITALVLDPSREHCQSALTSPVTDAVTLGEMFHKCKNILLDIVAKSNSELPRQYDLVPSIDFCNTPKPRSSNDTKFTKSKGKDVKPQINNKNTKTGSVTVAIPHVKSTHKDLQALLEHIVPYEVNNRINDMPGHCFASYVRNPNKRCNSRTSIGLADHHKVLETLSHCIKNGDYAKLPEHLEQILKVLLCGTHRNVALIYPKAKPRIDELRDFIVDLPQASKADRSIFEAWTTALANCSLSPPTHCSTPAGSPTTVPHKLNTTANPSSNAISGLPGFLPYKPTWLNDLAVTNALKKMIIRPLSPTDMKDGFIYIFWDRGNFGMVKIGRTNNLERRLKEWNRCKSTHSYHKASLNGELLKVPHVQRIEKLIHIDLVNARKERACKTCVKTKVHNEWFNISEAKAVEVFRKWRNWILQEPYMENDEGKWVIRPEMLEALPENCRLEPIPENGRLELKRVRDSGTRPRTVNKSKRSVLQRSSATRALGTYGTYHSKNMERGQELSVQ